MTVLKVENSRIADRMIAGPTENREFLSSGGSGGDVARLFGSSANWHVLLVEEVDEGDGESLVRRLERHGHRVSRAGSGGAALRTYEDSDLVLLDLDLSDLDGLEVCKTIRTMSDVPVIVVTTRATELDCVLSLYAGADDYLVKPYGYRELMARMESVMRRARPQSFAAKVVSHGPLRVDAASRSVSLRGQTVEVTRKEFDLLYLLASKPNTVISRKQVMQCVWGDSWSRRTADTHVSSLRNKLGSSNWIITVRGVGFRFGHE